MSLGSTVGLVKSNSKSLKTTIPEGIVVYLELRVGDKLEWKMSSNEDGERVTVVRKAKPINNARSAKAKRR
jgi:transcription termination factor Rho